MSKPKFVIVDTDELTIDEFDDASHYRKDIIKVVPSQKWLNKLKELFEKERKIRKMERRERTKRF